MKPTFRPGLYDPGQAWLSAAPADPDPQVIADLSKDTKAPIMAGTRANHPSPQCRRKLCRSRPGNGYRVPAVGKQKNSVVLSGRCYNKSQEDKSGSLHPTFPSMQI